MRKQKKTRYHQLSAAQLRRMLARSRKIIVTDVPINMVIV